MNSDLSKLRRLIVPLIRIGGLLPLAIDFVRSGGEGWWSAASTTGPLDFRPMVLWQQYLAVITGFVIKPVYMLIAVILVAVLRRQTKPDLVALRWSCVFFFAGEAFCAINYAGFNERSHVMEYLHSFGMVLAFAAGAYAVMELLDLRVLHFSDPTKPCQLAGLCRGCATQRDGRPCRLRGLLNLTLPMLVVLAAIPLTAPLHYEAYATRIFGTGYTYRHDVVHQQYEIRYLPAAAMLIFCIAWLILQREPHPLVRTRLLMAAGLGAMGFAWFRWTLLAAFANDRVWFVAWEEITELFSMCAVAALLYVFRLWTSPSRARNSLVQDPSRSHYSPR